MEEELDLRKYVRIMLKHWKLIGSICVVAVIAAVLVSVLSPRAAPVYEAEAAVAITQESSEISPAPEISDLVSQTQKCQRETLLALVKSPDVTSGAIALLADQLAPAESNPTGALWQTEAELVGDIIKVSVRSEDPDKAVAAANAWVKSYRDFVNSLYDTRLQQLEELQVLTDATWAEYQATQQALVDFQETSRLQQISEQISDKELLCDVKSLRDVMATGSTSPASTAANSLALILLQTQASATLPAQVQVNLGDLAGLGASTGEQLAAADALISVLESRSATTPGRSIADLRQDVRQLNVDLATEKTKETVAIQSRDAVWETYTVLQKEATGIRLAAPDVALTLAWEAATPQQKGLSSNLRLMNVAIALVLGLVVGVLVAFGVEYFREPPDRPEREQVSVAATPEDTPGETDKR